MRLLHGTSTFQPSHMLTRSVGRPGLRIQDGCVNLRYKYDHKLFRPYTKNAAEMKLIGLFFAGDCALLASTRSGADKTV